MDSQENSSDIFIPVILNESEDTEENLNNIASDMITQCTVVETSVIEEPIINEDISDELANTEEDTIIQYTQPENILITEEPLISDDISLVN